MNGLIISIITRIGGLTALHKKRGQSNDRPTRYKLTFPTDI